MSSIVLLQADARRIPLEIIPFMRVFAPRLIGACGPMALGETKENLA